MGTITFIVLLLFAAILFLSAHKGWLGKATLERLAQVAAIVALIAAILVFIIPVATKNTSRIETSSTDAAISTNPASFTTTTPNLATLVIPRDMSTLTVIETPASTNKKWQNWIQVHSFPAPGDEPTGIVRIENNIWVIVPCSNRIYRLDLEGNLVAELEIPQPGCGPRDIGLAWDGTSLWGTWWNGVLQIEPNSGQALSNFNVDLEGCSISWNGSSLWVVDRTGNLSVYDQSGKQLRRLAIPVFGVVSAITWANGELWMLDEFGKITRFDENFLEIDSFSLASMCGISSFHQQKSFGMYWDGANLWVADSVNNRIYQCAPID